MRPADRIERLHSSVHRGWARVRSDPDERELALGWIDAHPSARPDIDDLWRGALGGEGPLALWLDSGMEIDAWLHPIEIRCVLASHPFAALNRWSTRTKSNPS
jgi:hypothetical protein